MGIPKQGIELFIKFKNMGLFNGFKSVIELGSQDIVKHTINASEFCNLFCIEQTENIDNIFAKDRISSKIMYDNLGFAEYKCIDLDEAHNAYKFDLNYNIKEKYSFDKTFDLVYNGGTTEHCFNQAACFENIHNLCRVGGLMMHAIPLTGYINHGFFNYSPILFELLALHNNYKIDFMLFGGEINGYTFFDDFDFEHKKNQFADNNIHTVLVVGLRKNLNSDFKYPYQYLGEHYFFDRNKIYSYFNFKINIELSKIKYEISKYDSIAIFGCGRASQIATNIINELECTINYYIDDIQNGEFNNKNILKREDFMHNLETKSTLIIIGPQQKGNFDDLKQKYSLFHLTESIINGFFNK